MVHFLIILSVTYAYCHMEPVNLGLIVRQLFPATIHNAKPRPITLKSSVKSSLNKRTIFVVRSCFLFEMNATRIFSYFPIVSIDEDFLDHLANK